MIEAWFVWNGRMGRLAYLGYSFLLAIILVVLALILMWPARNTTNASALILVVSLVIGAVGVWGSVCLAVKRLHDLDLSGWHYLWMGLLPGVLSGIGSGAHILALSLLGGFLSLGVLLYLLLWPGTEGGNRFGYQS
jgi:uncharacterized membrane protein YhaH (DUF805 family)